MRESQCLDTDSNLIKDLTGNLERMRSYIYKFTYLTARDDEHPLLFFLFPWRLLGFMISRGFHGKLRGGNRCRIEGPEFMYPRAQLRFYKCYICRPSNEEPTSSFFIYIYKY